MSIEIKLYEKIPPRIEVIKVTRGNYNEVATELGIKRVTVSQGEFDLIQTVSLIPSTGDALVFKIPTDSTSSYEAYIYRDLTQKDSTWAVIRQYDLSFGYFELAAKAKKENA